MAPRTKRPFAGRKRSIINIKVQSILIGYSSLFYVLGALNTRFLHNFDLSDSLQLYGASIPIWVLFALQICVLVLMILLGFWLTNKVAGPMFNLNRHIERAAREQDYSELKFRKYDFFQEVSVAYNKLLGKLRKDDEKGFSLVELMIAVAIAGILATIAVPKYDALIDRVHIKNAKANLSTLYGAEKAYYADSGSYTTRLDVIGFGVDGKTYFNLGFEIDFPPQVGPTGNPQCIQLCNPGCILSTQAICMQEAQNGLDGNVWGYATASNFLATGHSHFGGVFSGPNQRAYSISIDDQKNIKDIMPAY